MAAKKGRKPGRRPINSPQKVHKVQGNPWDRQSWDTNLSFVAFQFYRNTDPPRNLSEIFRTFSGQQGSGKKPPPQWERWSQGRDNSGQDIPGSLTWAQRAHAWDDHLIRLADHKKEQQIKIMKEKTRETLVNLLDSIQGGLVQWNPKIDTDLGEYARTLAVVVSLMLTLYPSDEGGESAKDTEAAKLTPMERLKKIREALAGD